MRSRGWTPHDKISALRRRDPRELAGSLALPRGLPRPWEDAAGRQPSTSQDEPTPEADHAGARTDLGLPASRTTRKQVSAVQAPWSAVFCHNSLRRQSTQVIHVYHREKKKKENIDYKSPIYIAKRESILCRHFSVLYIITYCIVLNGIIL